MVLNRESAHTYLKNITGMEEDVRQSLHKFIDNKNAPLGFYVAEMRCSFCGAISIGIFPIPLKMPTICGNCGRKTSYIG